MPQMMPLNWLFLFFFFIIIFILFNMLNYFIFKINLNNKLSNNNYLKSLNFTWKL
nr:ATP synthase F0 subunit 8 [Monopis longella]